MNKLELKVNDKTQEFFEQHNIDEIDLKTLRTEIFFKRMGFIIDKEAIIDRTQLSSIKYLLKNSTLEQLSKLKNAGKIQATWRLRIAID